ncbi:MAG: protease modulator HflC [Gammaproteobacteria bacterium]
MMALHRSFISLILAIIVLLLVSQSVGVVPEGQTGVRLRFGSVVEAGLKPGLHFKLPFVEQITGLDAQWITLNGEREGSGRMKFVTADGKTFDAGYAAVWRISDAGAFCRATDCDERSGARRINDALTSLLRQLFAAHTAGELLTGSDTALLRDLPGRLNAQLYALGAEVQAVRLTALTLPRDQLDAVYQRMRAQQLEQAAQIRVQGSVSADELRAKADQQQAVILAQAETRAQTIRGQAVAEATAIYARAYRQDPEFFRFYRSLEAYRRVIRKNNSIIVLGPDSGFLKYFDGLQPPAAAHR